MAGKTVTITSGEYVGEEYRVWKIGGIVCMALRGWMQTEIQPLCSMALGVDSGNCRWTMRYCTGRSGAFGHLVHVSEIDGAKTG